jgi:hypothetical protein
MRESVAGLYSYEAVYTRTKPVFEELFNERNKN